jgi:hypothetical protein
LKYRITKISPNPIALFVAVCAFLLIAAATVPSYLQIFKLAENELLFEAMGFTWVEFFLSPLLAFVIGYIGSFILVLVFNLIAKLTGGVVIEYAEVKES